MTVLLLYSSHDGQTRKIANHIAQQLQGKLLCELRDLQQNEPVNLNDYRAIVVGASIRYGHFNRRLAQFVTRHQDVLNQKPSAFYAVNLTARKVEKRSPETNVYTRKFLQKSPWTPQLSTVFAGALRYPRYRWFDRVMIQLIMRMTGGETDTSKEIEYTDWQQVNEFAQSLQQLLAPAPSASDN
ncbi:MAG: menaquinone-dependent protoporphyrinogen IX dehydrogenase [Enterobacteriaceae bacterium]